jgi:hypothetical protein
MKILFDLVKRAKSLNQDKILKEVFSDTGIQEIILDMNRSQLYDSGVDATGTLLSGYGFGAGVGKYSFATIYGTKNIKGKIAKNQRTDHITLRDTGAFYKSLKFDNKLYEFLIKGKTDKGGGDDLQTNFGQDILGLTDENKNKVSELIKSPFIATTREVLIG